MEAINVPFLVVDDDDTFRTRLVRALTDRGYIANSASTGDEAIQAVQAGAMFKVILDLRLDSENGIDLIPQLLSRNSMLKIVVLTGYGSIATAIEAIKRGATHYLTKPADVDSIVTAFERDQNTIEAPRIPPSLERVEWEHLQRVLSDFGGNITQAAKALKMHRRSLQRKLAKAPPN